MNPEKDTPTNTPAQGNNQVAPVNSANESSQSSVKNSSTINGVKDDLLSNQIANEPVLKEESFGGGVPKEVLQPNSVATKHHAFWKNLVVPAAAILILLALGFGGYAAWRNANQQAKDASVAERFGSTTFDLNNLGPNGANTNPGLVVIHGNEVVDGSVTANSFNGNGAGLTGVNAEFLNSQPGSFYQDASNLDSGTLNDARLSSNVALLNANQSFSGNNTFAGGATFTGSLSLPRTNTIGSFTYTWPGAQPIGSTVLLNDGSGNLSWADATGACPTCVLNGGNSYGTAVVVGSNDVQELRLRTAGVNRVVIDTSGNTNFSGSVTAASFIGDGTAVSNVDAALLGGQAGSFYQNASNINAGTLSNSRLSAAVTLQGNAFNGANELVQLDGLGFLPTLNGSNLNSLNASNIGSGTLSDARLSANVALLDTNQIYSGSNTYSNNQTFSSGITTNSVNPTGTLTVGSTTQNLTLQGDGTVALTTTTGGITTTINFKNVPVGNVTYQFDRATAAGTYEICTSVGNCASSGGGVTTLGGTTNKVARFTGTQSIGDGSITDTGSAVTIQPGANSTSTFSVLTLGSSSVFGVDTTNSRVGVNNATPTYPLDVTGDINSSTGLRVGGTLVCDNTGCTAASGGGSYIQNTTGLQTNANFSFQSSAAGSIGGAIRAAIAQSADLLQIQNSGGASIANIDASGNINTTGQFQVGGVQIASTNLSDGSNLAKLNGTGPQIFTGNNKFTGNTLVFQPAANSINAMQIFASGGGTSIFNADTTNSRIGINNNSPGYALDVNGDINSSSALRVGGTTVCTITGCTAASGSGSYIQNGTALQTTANFNIQSAAAGSIGGIIRGAVGQTADLQRWQTSTGLVVGSVGATGAALFQNSANSTTAFQIQDSAGTSNVFNVDTTNTRIGIGTNAPISTIQANAAGGAIETLGNTNTNVSNLAKIGQINFWGNDSQLVTQNVYGSISVAADGDTTTDSANGQLLFATTSSTAGPITHLTLSSTAAGQLTFSGTDPVMKINDTTSTMTSQLGFYSGSSTRYGVVGSLSNNMVLQSDIGPLLITQAAAAQNIVVSTNGTTRLTFTPDANAYFGNGVTNAAPAAFTLNATGGSGSNIAGAALNIAGGRGTGSAVGGGLNFQTSAAGGAGASLNSLATVFGLAGGTGNATFQATADSSSAFRVLSSGGNDRFTVDTSDAVVGNLRTGATGTSAQFNIFGGNGDAVLSLDSGTGSGDEAKIEFTKQHTITLRLNGGTTANRTIELPDEDGTLCLQNSANCGFATGSGSAFVQGGNSFGGTATIGTNDANSLAFETGGTTACSISSSDQSLSCPGAGASSERFGSGSTAAGVSSVALGNGASASAIYTIAIGRSAAASASDGLALGRSASSTGISGIAIGSGSSATTGVALGVNASAAAGIAIGQSASTTCGNCIAIGPSAVGGNTSGIAIGASATVSNASYPNIAIGTQASATHDQTFVIGYQAASTAANQWVVGSSNSFAISNAYFGKGVVSAAPAGFTLNATGGSGTNIAGAALTLAGGKGTGTGNGGAINFQTSAAAGSTGSSLNSLSTVFSLAGGTGNALFKNTAQSTTAFQIQNNGGTALLTVDTVNTSVTVNKQLTVTGGVTAGGPLNALLVTGARSDEATTFNLRNISTDGSAGSVAINLQASRQTSGTVDSAATISSGEESNWGSTGPDPGFLSLKVNDGVQLRERMRFTSTGIIYLGDGITSSTASSNPVVIQGTGGSGTDIAGAALTIAGGKGTGTGAGGSIIFQTAAAGSTGSSLNSLATVMSINSAGTVAIGSNFSISNAGNITSSATGNQRIMGNGGALIFGSSGEASTGVIRIRNTDTIAWRNAGNTGNITAGVNASDIFQVTSPAADGSTVAQFNNAGATNCTVQPGGTGFACSSDERLKTNIMNLESGDATELVNKLQGVSFNWITNPDGQTQVGFIAQDLMKYIPSAVSKDSNGYYVANYSAIIPYLVEAFKKQQTQIDTLRNTPTGTSVDVLKTLADAKAVTLSGDLTVGGNVVVKGRIEASSDNTGSVTIPAGQTSVHVALPSAFSKKPKVNLTPEDFVDGQYRVTNITKTGFTIELQKAQSSEVLFDWQAL